MLKRVVDSRPSAGSEGRHASRWSTHVIRRFDPTVKGPKPYCFRGFGGGVGLEVCWRQRLADPPLTGRITSTGCDLDAARESPNRRASTSPIDIQILDIVIRSGSTFRRPPIGGPICNKEFA